MIQPIEDSAENPSAISARVSIRLVHAARRIRLSAGGAVIHEWTPGVDDLLLEEPVTLPFSEDRSELPIEIEWPPGTPDSVAELRVEPDGLPARSINVWGSSGGADEVVAFSWNGGDR